MKLPSMNQTSMNQTSINQPPCAPIPETDSTKSDDCLIAAQKWLESGLGVALARVVETWGASPRPVGACLAINEDGAFQGSVSGGCVEGAVVTQALETIAGAGPHMLEFGIADETAWKVGLTCGGRIRIHVEALTKPS